MKKIGLLIWLGLMINVVCSFLGTYAETGVPVLSVGDRWSYGWFNGEFTNATGEVGGHMMNVTVVGVEDFEGVPCYVCVYSYPIDPNDLIRFRTYTFWITSDWVVLKTEDFFVSPEAETRTTFVWSLGMKLFDFPLTVGKEWSDRSYRTIEQTTWELEDHEEETETAADYIDWSRKVVATETVTVPAGTFETYVLEGFGGEPPMWLEQRFYFSLDAKNHVKAEAAGGGGEVLTSFELASQGEEGEVFSDWLVPVVFTVSFGILGFTYFIIGRRQRKPWNSDRNLPKN